MANFLNLCIGRTEFYYILNIDIYYIEASVTRDRTVTDDRNTPIRTGVNGDVGEEGQGDVYPAK